MFAVKNAASLQKMAERMKSEEISDEIFGTLGYKNALRFFRNDQEQEQYTKENPQQPPLEVQLAQMEDKRQTKDNESRHQRETMKLEMTAQLGFAKMLLDKGMGYEDVMLKMGIAKLQDKTTRQGKALDNVIKMSEMQLRRETGARI